MSDEQGYKEKELEIKITHIITSAPPYSVAQARVPFNIRQECTKFIRAQLTEAIMNLADETENVGNGSIHTADVLRIINKM